MVFLIILAAVVVLLFAFGIAQNQRDIEYLIKQQNSITISYESMKSTINASHEFYDAQIAQIISRMEASAKGIGKLDELDTRVKQVDAKASDALRILVLNGMDTKNSGVKWASEFKCDDDEGESHG